jgi:hypothetical protein
VRKFGSEFQRADESFVSALSLMAPVFELPLSDVTVSDGESAVLECRVVSTPSAEITWYVDGIEIRQSTEFQMTYSEDGWCRLVISDTMSEDEGEYTVKAVNEAGSCVTTAYLTVLRKCSVERFIVIIIVIIIIIIMIIIIIIIRLWFAGEKKKNNSAGRNYLHNTISVIIWRALRRTMMPATREPMGLVR